VKNRSQKNLFDLSLGPATPSGRQIELLGGALLRGPVARAVNDAEQLAGVGQGNDQRVIAPVLVALSCSLFRTKKTLQEPRISFLGTGRVRYNQPWNKRDYLRRRREISVPGVEQKGF